MICTQLIGDGNDAALNAAGNVTNVSPLLLNTAYALKDKKNMTNKW